MIINNIIANNSHNIYKIPSLVLTMADKNAIIYFLLTFKIFALIFEQKHRHKYHIQQNP